MNTLHTCLDFCLHNYGFTPLHTLTYFFILLHALFVIFIILLNKIAYFCIILLTFVIFEYFWVAIYFFVKFWYNFIYLCVLMHTNAYFCILMHLSSYFVILFVLYLLLLLPGRWWALKGWISKGQGQAAVGLCTKFVFEPWFVNSIQIIYEAPLNNLKLKWNPLEYKHYCVW